MNLIEPGFRHGVVSAPSEGRSIGAILVDSGHLSAENAEKIIHHQKQHGLRFGDAAVKLGIVSEETIRYALAQQFDYPYLAAGDVNLSPELHAAYKPFSPVVEQLRALRSQLMLRWFDSQESRKTLAIVSPGRGEGRSFIAANLAVVFSQLGERTLLIDADLRRPRQHQLFNLGNTAGLSDVLAGRTDEHTAINRIDGLVGLQVLPAGAVPPNPQELVGRAAFSRLLTSLAANHDVIIIDTPDAQASADAHTIAARAGAAVLLGRRNRTPMAELARLAANLQIAGTRLVGSVLNEA